MKPLLSSILHIFTYITLFNIQENKEIKFVFEFLRHGARPPSYGLNSTNQDLFGETWTSGSGVLTPVGKRQLYLTGYSARQRYSQFLNKVFNISEIQVLSSNTSRTIMSAYSHLNGLFPVLESSAQINKRSNPPVNLSDIDSEELSNLDKEINKLQMFPVHIIEKGNIYLNLDEKQYCPPLEVIYNETDSKREESYKKFQSKYGEKIYNYFGFNITDFEKATIFADTLICDYYDNRTQVYDKLVKAGVSNVSELVQDSITVLHDSLYLKLQGENSLAALITKSPLMENIESVMDRKITSENSTKISQKMTLYVLHDDDLAALNVFISVALEKKVSPYVYFGSSLTFELYKVDENERKIYKPSVRSLAQIGQRSKKYQDHKSIYDEYFVKIQFDEEMVYYDSFSNFRKDLGTKIFSIDDIDKFCYLNVMDKFLHLKLISILSILSFGLITYIIYNKTSKMIKQEELTLLSS
jgi:hypothetical protein